MPNDPDPTPTPAITTRSTTAGVSAMAAWTDVAATIKELDPPHQSRHATGSDVVLSVRVFLEVKPDSPTPYDFQITLNSITRPTNPKPAGGKISDPILGGHGLCRLTLSQGSGIEVYLETDHVEAKQETYELEAMVLASPTGIGDFRQITLLPGVGDGLRTYDVG